MGYDNKYKWDSAMAKHLERLDEKLLIKIGTWG